MLGAVEIGKSVGKEPSRSHHPNGDQTKKEERESHGCPSIRPGTLATSPVQRYLQIYRQFVVSSFVRELEFRANFFAKIVQNLAWVFFFVLMILVIYRNTDSIAGWSRGEAFVLSSAALLLYNLVTFFCMSLIEIPEHIRKGTLDFVVTKPVDSQFWVSLRRCNFDQLGAIFAGFILIAYGLHESRLIPSAEQWLAFLITVIAANFIFYAFQFFLMTLGIWLVRVDNLMVLGETVMTISRYPMDIFNANVQRIFLFVLPVAFLATIPAQQLVHGAHWGWVAGSVGWAAAFFFSSRSLWKFAMRSYSSASS